ncbi:MAG: hypothetical protein ABWZ40_05925 [Caulobacterales bacterium]
MVPDFDLQLQVAIKALRDAVAPAVDPGNSVAKEQLQLAIGTLSIVQSRLPLARRYVRRLSEDAIQLGEKVADVVGKASAHISAMKTALEDMKEALADPEADTAELESARNTLISAICEVIEAAPLTTKLQALVVQESTSSINRERAWYISSGFEPDKTAVAPIEELI